MTPENQMRLRAIIYLLLFITIIGAAVARWT